jgi:hypothetical protein
MSPAVRSARPAVSWRVPPACTSGFRFMRRRPHLMSSCSVRPVSHRNHKDSHPALRIVSSYDRGTRQVCAPSRRVRWWKEKHEVRVPVPGSVVQVPLLRHHVAHRARFRRRQFLLVKSSLEVIEHLSFGSSSQYRLGFQNRLREVGAHGRRI